MALSQASITVSVLPRQWFEAFVAELYDAIEKARVSDGALVTDFGAVEGIRLVEGRHPVTGARYRLDGDRGANDDWTGELVVTGWDRIGETSVEITSSDGNGTTCGALSFRSAAQPRTCTTTGTYQGSGRLRQVSWEGSADLEQWWDQASGARKKRGVPAIRARLSHPLASARLAMVPEPADDGRWSIHVSLVARGCSWARPIVALASLFGGFALRRVFERGLDEVQRRWDDTVPALVKDDPRYAVEKCLTSL
jgi:hypothetical protein